ncbi:1-acyl-sn-glycerol-3-phosphate acyltransferase [Pendulispora rubella]|uniref:1-acyl-sn-glycerol-3-phosphate acyltransferase n=1 Tax=Pendulispora rubella TaxID=2741070 RepID=A0ABZ2LD09_9BACT
MLSSRLSPERGSLALSLRTVYETFAISWPTVVDAALGRVRKDVCDERLRSWSQKIVAHTRIHLDVRGREHLEKGSSFLVMSNHQSHYDIPVVFAVVGGNIRMITKKELFKVPVFGAAMREAGFIEIDRSNRQRAVESLEIAKKMVAERVHVWIAPEGTRSRTGELLPFKKGGFNLALEAQLSVLPVTIDGTKDILPPDTMRSHADVNVKIVIHPPIDARAYGSNGRPGEGRVADFKASRDKLMRDVREAIERGF